MSPKLRQHYIDEISKATQILAKDGFMTHETETIMCMVRSMNIENASPVQEVKLEKISRELKEIDFLTEEEMQYIKQVGVGL